MVVGADPDLALLAGDYLYALGLERLAALGDLEAIRELSDLISLSAQLHDAEGGARAARCSVAGLGDRDRRRAAHPGTSRESRRFARAIPTRGARFGRRLLGRPSRRASAAGWSGRPRR